MLDFSIEGVFLRVLLVLAPGAIASLSLFRDRSLAERILLGAFSSYLIFQILGFLTLLIGIPFSDISVKALLLLMYAGALALILKKGVDVKVDKTSLLEGLALFAVLYVAFVLRFSPVSPIYYELDPYFYAYPSIQLIETGTIPLTDDTAWWPLVNASHRTVPGLAYYQASIYQLTYGGGSADSYLLAFTSNFYPPLAGLFMAFFAYLLFKERFGLLAGLIAAILFATTPILVFKMYSGVFEAQPNSLAFHLAFLAMMYIASLNKGKEYMWLLFLISFGYWTSTTQFHLALGIVFVTAIFTLLEKRESLFEVIKYSSLGLLLGLILFIIYSLKVKPYTLLYGLVFSFLAAYSVYGRKVVEELGSNIRLLFRGKGLYVLAVFILGFIILGNLIFNLTVSFGTYTQPLKRTIAEQQPTGSVLEGSLGALAYTFVDQNGVERFPLSGILAAFSSMFSFPLELAISFIQKTGASLIYIPKLPSVFFLLFGAISILFVYSLYLHFRKKIQMDFLLFLSFALFFPISVMALLLVKYSVHMALVAALAASYVLGYLFELLATRWKEASVLAFGVVLLAVNSVNMYEPTGISLLTASASQKPAYDISILNATFGDMCDNSYCSNPNLTVSQVCSLGNYPSLCRLFNPSAEVGVVCKSPEREALCSIAKGEAPLSERFSSELCRTYLITKNSPPLTEKENLAISRACGNTLPSVWLEAMDWLRENTPEGARITSWWDYGHWINYWARRNAVLRNEHASTYMIGEIAHMYIMGSEEEALNITKRFGSDYLLVDKEILFSGDNSFGGKFYALNYLACARNNETDETRGQLQSKCELDNLWETVIVSNEPCLISDITNTTGRVAYSLQGPLSSREDLQRAKRTYCFTYKTTQQGQQVPLTYYLNESDELGLRLNKGILVPLGDGYFQVFYTKDKMWNVNGTLVDGWEDRKGRFYDSVVYKAFVLGELEGWDKVYDNGYVKIFKRRES